MAKQLVHIGLAVATDGIMPVRNNILNIAAVCGDAYKFNENIYPQTGEYKESPFWVKHPAEFAALRVAPVTLAEAMAKLREWLKQFQGTLVACATSIDYWHLLNAFFSTGKDCPFGTLPIDTGTLMMEREGRRRPISCTANAEPLAVAHARWHLATNGRMPQFGAPPHKRKRLPGTLRITEELRAREELARAAGLTFAQRLRAQRAVDDALFAPTTTWNATVAVPAYIETHDEREDMD